MILMIISITFISEIKILILLIDHKCEFRKIKIKENTIEACLIYPSSRQIFGKGTL